MDLLRSGDLSSENFEGNFDSYSPSCIRSGFGSVNVMLRKKKEKNENRCCCSGSEIELCFW